MRDHDAALDSAIHEVVRLLFPDPASPQVDLSETESPHVTAG
jgi:hypothetical protein